MTQTTRFLSLYDAELEEDTSDEPLHGQFLSTEGKDISKQVGGTSSKDFAKTLQNVLAKTNKS